MLGVAGSHDRACRAPFLNRNIQGRGSSQALHERGPKLPDECDVGSQDGVQYPCIRFAEIPCRHILFAPIVASRCLLAARVDARVRSVG